MEFADIVIQLSRAAGPSGFEGDAAREIKALLAPFVDSLETDSLGNVIAVKRRGGEGAKKLMLCAHIDEIGLIVTGYERGFLRVAPIGGMDLRCLPAARVKLLTAEPLYGVVDVLPPHLLSAEDMDKTLEADKLFVDAGLSEEAVRERVPLGTPAVPDAFCGRLGTNGLSGRALDNRACAAVLVKTMQSLGGKTPGADIYAVFSVQEELGSRGAKTAAWAVAPEVCVVLDATFGAQPDTKPEGTFKLGGGPAIGIGPNVSRDIYGRLTALARERDIPYQVEVLPGNSGTDAWMVQVSRGGVRTALLSLPLKYMHTPVETLDIRDGERSAELLTAFCETCWEAL